MKRKVDQQYTRKRSSRQHWKAWFAGFSVLLLASISGAGYYMYKKTEKPVEFKQGVYQHFSQITTWVTTRKGHLREGVTKQVEKVKRLSKANTEEDQSVHFEFYSALPAMQVTKPQAVPMKEETKQAKAKTEPARKPSAIAETPIIKSLAGRALFLDPAELERDFVRNRPQKAFVIQVGTFNSLASAVSLKDTLKAKAFNSEIISIYMGDRKVYRVQVGPYNNREQLREAEQSLKKQGVSGIVRKVEIS